MEKADPDDLLVEVTTFQKGEDKSESGCSIDSEDESYQNLKIDHRDRKQLPEKSTTLHKYFENILQLPKEIRNIIAGGVAGMCAKSFVAPFDRIKILYQVSSAKFNILHIPKIGQRIVKEEGPQALWKGNTATLIRVFPYSGIQFMVFDRCKTFVLREQERRFKEERAMNPVTPKPKWGLSPIESLCAGMTAGAVSVVMTYPLDLTRAQLAVLRLKKGKDSQSNMGFLRTLRGNYVDRGFTGLFRGITPTLMGILPYSGFAFSFNEQAKRRVYSFKKKKFDLFDFYLSLIFIAPSFKYCVNI